jgi:hypothetical protein
MRVLRFEVSGLRRRTPVRPVVLTGQTTHQSDWSNAAAPPSSVLLSWLCGSTKEPSGFLVNHRKPCELSVVSANRHWWLSSHVVPARPWFWGSTKKSSMTSSSYSCHHAARTWPCWPPGPSNESDLSSPHLDASPAMTFRACSSPAPTSVKPQPVPAILSQESVHTTLSITHHTRKRPSTGPQTTYGPQGGAAMGLWAGFGPASSFCSDSTHRKKFPKIDWNAFNYINISNKCKNVSNFNMEHHMLYVKSTKILNSNSNLKVTLPTNIATCFITLWNVFRDISISKHPAWQNMRNSLKFLPHPPCVIFWDIDKSHDFQNSYAFFSILKSFKRTSVNVFSYHDVQTCDFMSNASKWVQ